MRHAPALCAVLVAAIGLTAGPAGAHQTRVMVKTPVKDAPSSTAQTIGVLPPLRRVEVVECSGRGDRPGYCYVTGWGPDGWVAGSALEHPRPPALACPPNCPPRD